MKIQIKRSKNGITLGREIKDEELDFDFCPIGCGNLTDDPYGGPCTECWKNAPSK
ncbi:hypothetical protein [Tenacibaculum sp. 47A_GOM-205m]|uniref:hypothetical protein n=1 Tax=Tenacibaculum sp. 47A_GOM-205m TaxID=1380384 RepID=UPI0004ADF696|nr:hypothetical protein [Tenacibaculum sp. 47A_GOM-205m]